MRTNNILCVLALALLVLCSGCVTLPSAQTKNMADSGKLLNVTVAESFRWTYDVMNEALYLQNTDSTKAYVDYQSSINDNFKRATERRLASLNLIEAYLAAINTLASRNDAKAIRQSAIDLDAAVMGVNNYVPQEGQGTYKTMVAGLGSISDLITRYAIQGVQRKYLRLAIDTAKPGFDSTCSYLKSELKKCDALLGMQQDQALFRLITIRNTETNISKRRDWDMYIGKRIRTAKAMHSSYEKAQELLTQLPLALSETRKALDSRMKFKEAVTTLVSETKELKQCYDDITSANK